MTPLSYSGIKNTRYTTGQRIGRGGEGDVFEVEGNPLLVIKIYNEAVNSAKAEKLIFMASVVDNEITKFAAWPLDVIRDNAMRVCGFIMKKLEAYVPLHSLFLPMDRKKLFPDKGYAFLVHVARNLAMAFYKIHQFGIVIGDVNEANVLVNPSGLVALIDCDSFQINDGQRYHFCEVGIPRYTSPELLERGTFNNVIRTTNSDAFSLATLIFQLLFLGRQPFAGINLTQEEIDEEKAIKTNEFAYSLRRTNKKLLPAKFSLDLKYMAPGVINSFHEAFESRERPTARKWIMDLEELSKTIVVCSQFKVHQYPNTMQACPWCLFKDKAGVVFFLEDSYLKTGPEFTNIQQFVNGFKLEKLEIKKLSENYSSTNITADPIDKKFISLKNLNRIITGIVILITLGFSMFYNWGCLVAGAFLAWIIYAVSPVQKKLNNELAIRKKTFDDLKANFQAIVKQHNNPSDFNKYNQSANKLSSLINSFTNLPAEFTLSKKKIEEKHYNLKFNIFLQQFDVRYHQIPTFGASKKSLIYSNGIRTAADISKLNRIKINGIGPRNIQTLLDWQRFVGSGFNYSPDVNAIKYDINIAANEFAQKRQKLEIDIKNEFNFLISVKSQIVSSLDILERRHQELSPKLYQSELNLKAFQAFLK